MGGPHLSVSLLRETIWLDRDGRDKLWAAAATREDRGDGEDREDGEDRDDGEGQRGRGG